MKILYTLLSKGWFIPLFLVLLSIGIIFYKFTQIPHNLSFDEVDFAKLALSLDHKPYFVYSNLATGHSTLYFYILFFSIKIFGLTHFALRFPAALFGILNVLIMYAISKKTFNTNWAGFISAFLLITSRWYFNFARFSFEATFLLFLELLCILFLINYLDTKNRILFFLSALAAGLAFHSYCPGRIFFILPLVWIFLKDSKKNTLLFLIIFGITIAPLLSYTILHPDVRVSQILFISDPKLSLTYKIQGILSNSIKTIIMLFGKGDMNGRHNFPGKSALNPLTETFLIIGFISFIFKLRYKKKYLTFSFFFFLYAIISIIPTILSSPNDNPNMLRSFTLLPSLIICMVYGLVRLYNQTVVKKNIYIISGLLTVILIMSTLYELRTYFVFQSRVFNNSFEVICELKRVVDTSVVPKECRVQKNMF